MSITRELKDSSFRSIDEALNFIEWFSECRCPSQRDEKLYKEALMILRKRKNAENGVQQ